MGLSDLKKEGSWLWVNNSPLSSRYSQKKETACIVECKQVFDALT